MGPPGCAGLALRVSLPPQRVAAFPPAKSKKLSCFNHVRGSKLLARGIGFQVNDANESARPIEVAADLVEVAASLMVYQAAMKGSPGQAFLKLLAAWGSGSDRLILEAFAEFLRSLHESGASGWQDYLAEQVLLAKDNPLAKAGAKGERDGGQQARLPLLRPS